MEDQPELLETRVVWVEEDQQDRLQTQVVQDKVLILICSVLREWKLPYVQGIIVPNSGHWIPEEQPELVIKMLENFFGGNTTKTK